MTKKKDYKKFADNIETHPLFNEIRANFKERGFLSEEEFFCIVIWKANRAKSKVRRKIKNIKDLTLKVHDEPNNKKRLEILLKAGLRLPIASAVLAVLFPEFAVYDWRVRKQIGMKDITERKNDY